MGEEMSLDTMWDEAFGAESDGGEDTDTDTDTGADDSTGDEGDDGGDDANENDGDGGDVGGDKPNGEGDLAPRPALSEQELAEINAELGTSYRTSEEFPQVRRYIELRENGKFTASEALAAVGASAKSGRRDGSVMPTADSGKSHVTSSRARASNGEVMTSADKQELAKWGFKTEGKDLEKLWRRVGG